MKYRRPQHAKVLCSDGTRVSHAGDWDLSDRRFRLIRGRDGHWRICRNGVLAIAFLVEYDLENITFSTRREALRTLETMIEFDQGLPCGQRLLGPEIPDEQAWRACDSEIEELLLDAMRGSGFALTQKHIASAWMKVAAPLVLAS